MSVKLDKSELEALRLEQRQAGLSKRRYRKITVLIMLHQDHSVVAIEAALGVDDNTIYRYERAYHKVGLSEFLNDHYIAFTGRLTTKQELALGEHLDEVLYPDAKSICTYVAEQFGVSYTVAGMTDLLHRIGFTFKLSKSVPAKADDEAQVNFLQKTLPGVLEEVADNQAVVYFADGCHPTHNTKTSRGWIRKGQDFETDCNHGRKRVNINAAINALKPEHLVYDIAESINAQSTQRLARQLLRKHSRKKIYLICDNARYNRNKILTAWASGQRIEFIYLPTRRI